MLTPDVCATPLDTTALQQRLSTTIRQYTTPEADRAPAGAWPGVPTLHAHSPLQTVPLDIAAEIDTLLHPRHQLIDTPHRLSPAQLQPFVHGTTALRLIFPDKTVHAAHLHALHPTFLLAAPQHILEPPAPGALVLVLFPRAGQPPCVLQTVLTDDATAQLHLSYGDPRYDVRHRVQRAVAGTVYPAPPPLVPALRAHQLRICRIWHGPPQGTFPRDGGALTEQLGPSDTAGEPPDLAAGGASAASVCPLRDISLGGACLGLPPTWQPTTLGSRLLYLDIPVPIARAGQAAADGRVLRLQLFGVLRSLRTTPAPGTLHVRFLKRLPSELDACFAALAALPGGASSPP